MYDNMYIALLIVTIHAIHMTGVSAQSSCPGSEVASQTFGVSQGVGPAVTSVRGNIVSLMGCSGLCTEAGTCTSFKYSSVTKKCTLGMSEFVGTAMPPPHPANLNNVWFGPASSGRLSSANLQMAHGSGTSDISRSTQSSMNISRVLPFYDQIFNVSDTIEATEYGCIYLHSATELDAYVCAFHPSNASGDAGHSISYRDSVMDRTLLDAGQNCACAWEDMYTRNPTCCFTATYVYLATFNAMTSDSEPTIRVSFQAGIVTDGNISYVCLHYLDYTGPDDVGQPFASFAADYDYDAYNAPDAFTVHQGGTFLNNVSDPASAVTSSNVDIEGYYVYPLYA